jgi:flagellar hook-associated protein 3 FlgL
VSSQTADSGTLHAAASAARMALDGARTALSATIAGKALFSGTATDRPPLVSIEMMIATLTPLVAGATNADQIADAINAAFHAPGGPFETQFYLGATSAQGAPLDGDQRAATLPTAADPAIRSLLSGLTMAALAGDDSLSLSQDQRQALARHASLTLFNAGPGLTGLQANLGEAEARLDTLQTRLTGERSALDLARESLIGVDSFEAAGKLQEAQTRLEVLYAVTARTSRLSLVEYLR